jgi:tetratricopeptide (TPR) repeat protein
MVQKYHSLTPPRRALAAAVLLGGCSAAVLLSGCAAPAQQPDLPPSSASVVIPPAGVPPSIPPATGAPAQRPPPPPRENHLSPATRALVSQARTLLAHGDVDGASSTLDRALRIEPNNPLLWIELGRVRLAENDPHQAEGCGRKALALASGDHGTQRLAGQLLADGLRAEGRNQEAREVQSQPFMN